MIGGYPIRGRASNGVHLCRPSATWSTSIRICTCLPPTERFFAAAEDAEGRKTLAGYMLRAAMSLEKMTCDAASGTVI